MVLNVDYINVVTKSLAVTTQKINNFMMDLFFLFSNYRESGDESLTDCSLSTNNVTYDLIN